MFILNITALFGMYVGYRFLKGKPDSHAEDNPAAQPEATEILEDSPTYDIEKSAVHNENLPHTISLGLGCAATGLGIATYFGLALPLAGPTALMLTLGATVPGLAKAEAALRERRLDNDVLNSVVSVATLGVGQMLPAAIQATMYSLAHVMAAKAKGVTLQDLEGAISLPTHVLRRTADGTVETPAEALCLGDIITVGAGEIIPVDGVILEGEASIYEGDLRGEPIPVYKGVGEAVLAATVVLGGEVAIEVTTSGSATGAAQIAAQLAEASTFRSSQLLRAEQWSDRAVIPTLIVSVLASPIIGVPSAVALLFSVPTNALRSAGNLQTAGHLRAAARHGLLVKDGRGLEALNHVDTVLFDKTGTLTESTLELETIRAFGPDDDAFILSCAAALDERVAHPIAQAITQAAKERGLKLPNVEQRENIPGGGMQGQIDGKTVILGSHRFVMKACKGQSTPPPINTDSAPLSQHVFLAIDGKLCGALSFKPMLRPEAQQVIETLRKRGVTTIAVASGDSTRATHAVADTLGLDASYGELLPIDKADLVQQLQAEGRSVLFVGDGLNDALAMTRANASITLDGSPAAALGSAQLVLLDDSLEALPQAFQSSTNLQRDAGVTAGIWATYSLWAATAAAILRLGILVPTMTYFGTFIANSAYSLRPFLKDSERPEQ